jgi:hypothetical protein
MRLRASGNTISSVVFDVIDGVLSRGVRGGEVLFWCPPSYLPGMDSFGNGATVAR